MNSQSREEIQIKDWADMIEIIKYNLYFYSKLKYNFNIIK